MIWGIKSWNERRRSSDQCWFANKVGEVETWYFPEKQESDFKQILEGDFKQILESDFISGIKDVHSGRQPSESIIWRQRSCLNFQQLNQGQIRLDCKEMSQKYLIKGQIEINCKEMSQVDLVDRKEALCKHFFFLPANILTWQPHLSETEDLFCFRVNITFISKVTKCCSGQLEGEWLLKVSEPSLSAFQNNKRTLFSFAV